MALTIEGAPERITREQVNAALAALGLDPFTVVEVHLEPHVVEVVVRGFPQGHRNELVPRRNEVAKHRLTFGLNDRSRALVVRGAGDEVVDAPDLSASPPDYAG